MEFEMNIIATPAKIKSWNDDGIQMESLRNLGILFGILGILGILHQNHVESPDPAPNPKTNFFGKLEIFDIK